jgi:lysozyme
MLTVQDLIVRHEGLSLVKYQDTMGHWTIGVGHLLEGNPLPDYLYEPDGSISEATAMEVFDDDLQAVVTGLEVALPWSSSLDPVRLAVLTDMGFQMGVAGLCTFHQFLSLMKDGQYAAAAQDLQGTLLAKQTPQRVAENAQLLISGCWPSQDALVPASS